MRFDALKEMGQNHVTQVEKKLEGDLQSGTQSISNNVKKTVEFTVFFQEKKSEKLQVAMRAAAVMLTARTVCRRRLALLQLVRFTDSQPSPGGRLIPWRYLARFTASWSGGLAISQPGGPPTAGATGQYLNSR